MLVGLRARRLHRRPLAPVEDAELDAFVFAFNEFLFASTSPVPFLDVLCNEVKGLGLNITLEKTSLEGGSIL